MEQRKLGPFEVTAIGFGCMNVSHGYMPLPEEEHGIRVLNEALDKGYTLMDTAAVYGYGENEKLLKKAIMHRRSEFTLASKCGLYRGADGAPMVDGRPEILRKTCEESLQRLGTDVIDLYYLHRWDKTVPIEESVGALSRLVEEGKVRTIGLSEVSAKTLRKAHAVHPITALQTEYSLWTRNPEIAVLEACEELGTAFVAFSPVARGFLCDSVLDPASITGEDVRASMPRFSVENYPKNLSLLTEIREVAKEYDATIAQIALAWVISKAPHIIAIPGTRVLQHLRDNFDAGEITLSDADVLRLEASINQDTVIGGRYSEAAQASVDTEEF